MYLSVRITDPRSLAGQGQDLPPVLGPFDDDPGLGAGADLPPLNEFHEHVEIGELSGRRLTAEVYVPNGAGPHGAMLYLHGGAFCTLSPAHVRKLVEEAEPEVIEAVITQR